MQYIMIKPNLQIKSNIILRQLWFLSLSIWLGFQRQTSWETGQVLLKIIQIIVLKYFFIWGL